jgi:transposase InsO family protein
MEYAMEVYNNILCIEARWMINNEIMSESNYKKLSQRRDINVLRPGKGLDHPALVEFDSLPDRFKQRILEILPDLNSFSRNNLLKIQHNSSASHYFENYTYGDGKYLPKSKKAEYYANAVVLDAIHDFLNNRKAKRNAMGKKVTSCWERMAEFISQVDKTRFPHKLPTNLRSLERKYKEYLSKGYESLIHKSYLNGQKNASKVLSKEQESVLMMLSSDGRNLDNVQIAKLYNNAAQCFEWSKITSGTVANFRKKHQSVIHARLRGGNSFSNNVAMQVKRSAPTYPLYYWTMDGWDVELFYQDENSNYRRLTVTVVLDACTKYPVGYAIDKHENAEVNTLALKNAINHIKELFGMRYKTMQIQSDHYALSKMTPIYNAVAKVSTPAHAGNAKSKIIEPWFRYFNKKYCQMCFNWSGFGVTSRKELQPNGDLLNKRKKDFPTLEECVIQIESFIKQERAEHHDKYMKLWQEMPKDNLEIMSVEEYLRTFGVKSKTKGLLRGTGLTLTLNGQKRSYDCFDPSFRKLSSVKWSLIYDPDDCKVALAINEEETLQYLVEEKYIQPMAIAERSEGDFQQLSRIREFNTRLINDTAEEISNAQQIASSLIENRRELEDLRKFMLTDKSGQHKDVRNRKRLMHETEATEEIKVELFTTSENDYLRDY